MSDSIVMADTDDPSTVIDRVLRAMAILNTYTASIEDEDAQDRYVLWSIYDILNQVTGDIERIPVREQEEKPGKFTDDDPDRTPLPGLPPALPCPFCGTIEDINIAESDEPGSETGKHYRVTCGVCGVDAPGEATRLGAAQQWNKRVVRP